MRTQSKYRLLVVRLGAMGDILHALPAVTALRKAHPHWEIDWVVEPGWKALLSAHAGIGERGPAQPLVDGLHLAATKSWAKHPLRPETLGQIAALRKRLRTGGYDAVIDFQGAFRSAVLARFVSSRRCIGEAKPREAAARWFFTEHVVTSGTHVIDQDLELAVAVAGDDLQATPPWLPVDPAAESWCDNLLPAGSGQPIVLLNPGAGWGAKRWPVERYGAVANSLIKMGLRVLVNVGPGEEFLADSIREHTGGRAQPVACTLGQLIALTRRIGLMIAGDTGPLHLACALGKPVVGIYGPTDPSRNGPYGSRYRVLRSPESRRDHTRNEAPEAGLLTITPEAVLEAADALLAEETVR